MRIFDSNINCYGATTDNKMWFDLNGDDYAFVDRNYTGTVDFFILGDRRSSVQIDSKKNSNLQYGMDLKILLESNVTVETVM